MAQLTASTRRSLPKSDFGVPSKAPGRGSYPMPDKTHAKVAVGLAEMHGHHELAQKLKRKAQAKGLIKSSGGSKLKMSSLLH